MKDRKVHRLLVAWRREEIPEESLRFAEQRVAFLEGVTLDHTLRYLLACAYLQGVQDCTRAHFNNPALLTMDEVR